MRDRQFQVMVLSETDITDCPSEIKILPVGKISSEKGDFYVDKESYRLMKKEMERRGIDIVIDYEHQTLKDIQAPAGGWIKDIRWTPEAIIAKVEWTKRAEEYLRNREYRYLSPVIFCGKDGKAMVLHSAALTNTPAINRMYAIVNSVGIDAANNNIFTGGSKMEIKKLIELLGMDENATEDQIIQELEERLKKAEEKTDATEAGRNPDGEIVANSVILGLLGLSEDAKTEDVAGRIMTLKAGGADVQKQIQDLTDKMKEKEANDAVMMALKAGKITSAQKDWAKEYALKDKAGFDSFILKAPQVVPVGKITFSNTAAGKNTEVDPLVLKACGVSKEDIEKYAEKEETE